MSGVVKLSKPQQELLDAISAGVKVSLTPYAGRFNPKEYYRRWDTNAKCTTAARGLLEKGLVEKFEQTWRGHYLRLKQ
jgi:hypothetical protein